MLSPVLDTSCVLGCQARLPVERPPHKNQKKLTISEMERERRIDEEFIAPVVTSPHSPGLWYMFAFRGHDV